MNNTDNTTQTHANNELENFKASYTTDDLNKKLVRIATQLDKEAESFYEDLGFITNLISFFNRLDK